jgi:hypothetical protein
VAGYSSPIAAQGLGDGGNYVLPGDNTCTLGVGLHLDCTVNDCLIGGEVGGDGVGGIYSCCREV